MELNAMDCEPIEKARKVQKKAPHPVLSVFACILIFLVASIPESLVLLGVFTAKYLSDPVFLETFRDLAGTPFAAYDYLMGVFMEAPMMIVQLFVTVFCSALCVVYVVCIEKRPVRTMGITKKRAPVRYLAGMGIGALLIASVVGIECLIGACRFDGVALDSGWWIILLFFFGFLLQGFEEELLFRGTLMVSLSRRQSVRAAVAVNSLLFAAMHLANPGITFLSIVDIFLFGVFASLLFLRTGSIWVCAAVHSIWNFMQGNFFGLNVSGYDLYPSVFRFSETDVPSFIHGGKFGPEGGVTSIAVVLIAIVLLLVLPMRGKIEKSREASAE